MKLQELERGILIINFAAAGDGGSLFFECETTLNSKFTLLFTQYVFLDDPETEMLPGRIYLNQKLIDLKSEEEKLILNGITRFSITNELKGSDSELDSVLSEAFDRLVNFFNSDTVIEIKKKVDSNM